MISLPALDHLPAGWGILVPLNAVAVACLIPLIAYRVRRWWHRRSSPAAGSMAVTVLVLWLGLVLAWWWEALPPVVKAIEIAGGPGVLLVTALQLIVISLRSTSRPTSRERMWMVNTAALGVLAIMTIAIMMGDATSVDLRRYRFNLTPDMTNLGLIVATVTANVYMAAVLVQMIWLGIRRADNTPAGWGVGFLAAGAAASLIQVVHGGICNHIGLVFAPDSFWLTVLPSVVCAICLLVGLFVPPVLIHLQGRRLLLRLKPIRKHLIDEFPGLDTPLAPGTNRADVVYEWCSQIQDGLTLTAQQRRTALYGAVPPADLATHATAVTEWICGTEVPELNGTWLAAPKSVSSRDWTLALGDCYRQRGLPDCGAQDLEVTVRSRS